ncbi:hypothetical protein OZD67_04150 [Wolbachia endosymbiont of Drosophila nikananu]|uniref:hypothetical protein n=1 Tax=Wolbachia endosymbiont of Drosophila nikananu TaxID=375550 RepID=UPI0023A99BDA|nr:hypothetical protein [Wolbachia endosymbiont of Drosophila nikananu]MDE5061295.1 hypothetical protein [Wolbachia endosymbiont of Drosophila nikananu]
MSGRTNTDQYVIVDLRAAWARRKFLTFWRPNFAGYAYPLLWAGDYTSATVIEKDEYLTRRRYSVATGKYTGKWERFAVLRSVAEAIATAPPLGQIDGNAGPVVLNNKQNRDHLIANRLRLPPTERIRKAWTVRVAWWDEEGTMYGPSASKVRSKVHRDVDGVTFADITVRRCKDQDIILPVPDEVALGLTAKERDVLLHAHGSTCGDVMKAGFRDYYYTDQTNPVLCSLVEKGLMRKSDRGWEEGSSYFFTTDAGKHCANSLTPEYNP